MSKCPNCNTELAYNAKFCQKCGSEIKQYEPPTKKVNEKKKGQTAVIVVVVIGVLLILGLISKGSGDTGRSDISNSAFDGSVWQVKDYIEKTAKDPKSLEYVSWSKVVDTSKGKLVTCVFRGNNSFGAKVVNTGYFLLDSKGNVISADYK